MQYRLTALLGALFTAGSSGLIAADLIVNPGNPLAYQTLQAALNAAMPGDRILLAAPVFSDAILVNKSVTIEPLGPGRQQIMLMPTGSGGPSGILTIQALSPGIPLTFRRLDIVQSEFGSAPVGLRTAGTVPGEIRFDDVDVQRNYTSTNTLWGGGSMVNLATTVVWLRETSMTALDVMTNNGCIDLDGTSGTNCLVVAADTLRMEDCVLRASSANHLSYHCCFGSPPNCYGQYATGGYGGTALLATTRNSILVRCSLSDGNGGTVAPGPWLVPVNPGAAGNSVLGGQTGVLDPFALTWEHGLPGHVGGAFASRGATVALGPGAPLSITGPVTPGTWFGVEIDAPGASAFLLGIVWGETPTVLGTYWVQPFDVLLHGGGGTTQTYVVPNIPWLVGLPIVTQAVRLFPVIELTNPSGVAIR